MQNYINVIDVFKCSDLLTMGFKMFCAPRVFPIISNPPFFHEFLCSLCFSVKQWSLRIVHNNALAIQALYLVLRMLRMLFMPTISILSTEMLHTITDSC